MSHTIPNFHDDVKIGGHQIFMMTYRLGDKELHFNFSLSLPPLSLSYVVSARIRILFSRGFESIYV